MRIHTWSPQRAATAWLTRVGREAIFHSSDGSFKCIGYTDANKWLMHLSMGYSTLGSQREHVVKVALVGAPNAGKSTLINALAGRKVSAVSQKTNTTFRSRFGHFERGNVQALIYDTPGIVSKEQYLDQRHGDRVQSAWNIASSSDVTLLLIDAHRQLFRPDPRVVDLVEQFRDHIHADKYKDNTESSPGENSSTGLVLTKMDKVEAQQDTLECNRMIQEMTLLGKFENIFKISALRGGGLEGLREFILKHAHPGEWVVQPEDMSSPSEDMIAEIIREKIFRAYYKEIPYAVRIKVISIRDDNENLYLRADVLVPTNSMRVIVVGKQGAAISAVEHASMLELSRLYKTKIKLTLSVRLMDS